MLGQITKMVEEEGASCAGPNIGPVVWDRAEKWSRIYCGPWTASRWIRARTFVVTYTSRHTGVTKTVYCAEQMVLRPRAVEDQILLYLLAAVMKRGSRKRRKLDNFSPMPLYRKREIQRENRQWALERAMEREARTWSVGDTLDWESRQGPIGIEITGAKIAVTK